MAGYAVSCRIEGIAPRVARRPGEPLPEAATAPRTAPDETIDLVGRPLDEVLAERWARLREAWAQTTFFLFDPESWR